MIKSNQISNYRKKINALLGSLKKISSKCLYVDPLIHGIPGEVYRTCGKKTCKCMHNKDERHGPYKVIQIPFDGKKKQVSISKSKVELWIKAQHYQYQIKKLAEFRQVSKELGDLISEVINKRIEEFPKND